MSFWGEYVPVDVRQERAMRQMKKLMKKGKTIEPVERSGRTIAKKFWGKQWCEHLESFSDYSNRLPRGRTYVRNGSVCHLGIQKGKVEAYVSGSSLYTVDVKITPLIKSKWKEIKKKCMGQISSLLELLKGELSDSVMEVVANHREGLFPNEGEIHFSCSCPDWAGMCKHVAAVLYGVAKRLDDKPDLLFVLRGVDPKELVVSEISALTAESDDVIDSGLSELFGIDLEEEELPKPKKVEKPTKLKKRKRVSSKNNHSSRLTGIEIRELRNKRKLSVCEFAEVLGVTPASVYRWEKSKGVVKLYSRPAQAVEKMYKKE